MDSNLGVGQPRLLLVFFNDYCCSRVAYSLFRERERKTKSNNILVFLSLGFDTAYFYVVLNSLAYGFSGL